MQYNIEFKPTAVRELKKMDKLVAAQIVARIEKLKNNLEGDVKKLTNHMPEYRMRAGDYRILFEIVEDNVIIYHIKHRRNAY